MNILVIRMHRFGDVLQLTPMLQGLKRNYPDCRITFFTSSEMSDLLENNPDVDEVIAVPEKKFRHYLKNRPECYARIYNEMYELIAELKQRRFGLIINRHYEFGGILSWLIGAETILGQVFSPESGSFVQDPISVQLYAAILTNRKTNRLNLADWACHIAGLQPGCGEMCFRVPETDIFMADRLLSEHTVNDDPLVAVQMGAARSFRQWGEDNYLQIIQWLVDVKQQNVVLLGSEDEKGQAEMIRSYIGESHPYVIDLVGKTDFMTLGGVLKKCRKLITGDTGTMHMASAVGTQVLSLFYGSAFPWETGPYGTGHLVLYADEECAPCFYPEDCISGHSCRKAITPADVCRAFEVSEAISENRIKDIGFVSEKVKLYVTCAKAGYDQVLVDVNEITNTDDFRLSVHHSEVMDLTGCIDNFRTKGDQLLRKMRRGDIEGFTNLLPEYVGQWIKLVSYIKEKNPDENISETLVQRLYPAISEATRAMQARDYVALSDLIQYDFTPAAKFLHHPLSSCK